MGSQEKEQAVNDVVTRNILSDEHDSAATAVVVVARSPHPRRLSGKLEPRLLRRREPREADGPLRERDLVHVRTNRRGAEEADGPHGTECAVLLPGA